jgi:serine/threonine protein kinase
LIHFPQLYPTGIDKLLKILAASMALVMLEMKNLGNPTRRGLIKEMIGDSDAFSDFIGLMLKYDPKDRPTGLKLSQHPWLE